jgi:hypothetical protein
MCGNVGFVNSSTYAATYYPDELLLKFLLYVDTIRGFDSTGVGVIYSNLGSQGNEIEVYKKAMPGYDFVEMSSFKQLMNKPRRVGVIGHNRAATMGKVNTHSAHPFTYGDITLAHNGTLTSMYELDGDMTIDSERIAYTMGTSGKSPKEVIELLKGAYALVWYDKGKNTLNFARNEDRTLFYAFAKGYTKLIWASEAWMLNAASSKCNIPLDDNGAIYKVEPGIMLSFCLDHEQLNKPKTTKFTPYITPVRTSYKYNPYRYEEYNTKSDKNKNHNTARQGKYEYVKESLNKLGLKVGDAITFYVVKGAAFTKPHEVPQRGQLTGFWSSDTDSSKMATIFSAGCDLTKIGVTEDSNKNMDITCMGEVVAYYESGSWPHIVVKNVEVIDIDDDYRDIDTSPISRDKNVIPISDLAYKGPNGKYLTKLEFESLVYNGCVNCQAPIYPSDSDRIVWTNDKQPYCPDCVAEALAADVELINKEAN